MAAPVKQAMQRITHFDWGADGIALEPEVCSVPEAMAWASAALTRLQEIGALSADTHRVDQRPRSVHILSMLGHRQR